MRSIIICIIPCIMSMRFSIIIWRVAMSIGLLAFFYIPDIPILPIMDMPSFIDFM